jgi:lysophospholipase
VVLSQGRAEFIEKYFEVIGELQARGFAVLTHDWRGQGLSDRSKRSWLWGHARGWRPFIADFRHLLDRFEERLPKPWIAVGHSMGGGLTALALAEGEERFAGVVLSAPMLCVDTGERSTASVRRLALMMNFAGRSRHLVLPAPDPKAETFANNVLTHDRARWERAHAQMLADPGLKEGGVTWGWLAFALILCQRVIASRRIDRLDIPLIVVAAEAEKLVDNAASRAMAARAPLGRYVEVPGAYHEILMETDPRRALFWSEFDTVADQIAPASALEPRLTA